MKSSYSLNLSRKFLFTSILSSLVLSVFLAIGINQWIIYWIADVLPFAQRGFVIEPIPLFLALYALIPIMVVYTVLSILKIRRPFLIATIVGLPTVFAYTTVFNSTRSTAFVAVFLLAWVIFFVIREMVKEKRAV
jgi:hypothetical protein